MAANWLRSQGRSSRVWSRVKKRRVAMGLQGTESALRGYYTPVWAAGKAPRVGESQPPVVGLNRHTERRGRCCTIFTRTRS